MSFVEFLIEYYFYILAVLIVLIVGVIGFLVDSKNKKKKMAEVKEDSSSNAGQVVNNIDPLQNVPVNNVLNNEILNMQPVGGDNSVQNQVQPGVSNDNIPLNGTLSVNGGVVTSQEASVSLNNNILGNGIDTNMNVNQNNSSIMDSLQPVMNSLQPEGNNNLNLMGQVIQPIDVNNQVPVNSSLSGVSDISVIQGIQPVTSNNTVNNMSDNGIGVAYGQSMVSSIQPEVNNMAVNQASILNTQPQGNNNVNQITNSTVPVSVNNNNDMMNNFDMQPNMQNITSNTMTLPVTNQNNGMVNNVGANQVNTNLQTNSIPNQNMGNMGQQVSSQVYSSNNSQPFDISSMFGNNQ